MDHRSNLLPLLPFPSHGVYHHIPTQGRPVWSRPRLLTPDELCVARREFAHLQELGIICPSRSEWASLLHMAPKANSEWRPCGDYLQLNLISVPDGYSIPHIQDFSTGLVGAQVFSKVELIRGNHQVPVHPSDVHKTAITTPFGLWEFLCMPFSLRDVGQTFQRLMNGMLQELPIAFVYIDDILLASGIKEEHLQHLRAVFKELEANSFIIWPNKCLFGCSEIPFLGHLVSPDGIFPIPENLRAILEFPHHPAIHGLTLPWSSQFLPLFHLQGIFLAVAAATGLPQLTTQCRCPLG